MEAADHVERYGPEDRRYAQGEKPVCRAATRDVREPGHHPEPDEETDPTENDAEAFEDEVESLAAFHRFPPDLSEIADEL
jgi:hypothetical protein